MNSPSITHDASTAEEQALLTDLLARSALQDKQAFQQLYDVVAARLLGFLINKLRNKNEAEDLLQDVFIKIWASASSYRPHLGNAIAWLYTITHNKAIDYIRSSKYRDHQSLAQDDTAPISNSNDANIYYEFNQDDGIAIANCLEQLSGVQKNSILQAFYHGWTYDELAQRFATPIGTIKTRIRRGLKRLKECLSA